MLESRNSYGYGYIGTDRGYDWQYIPSKFDGLWALPVQGGEVYGDEVTAIKAGLKWLKKYNNSPCAQKYGIRHGKIVAIKNKRIFGY